ncbi:unnamed protein product [Haemonchus placei]|uniref:Uncharacterized protein n=1 Tax=Haemonchus placei TaxID=6290 RepID=A0A3P7V0E8_HAEPC|nr:unnamed protein product [Haemonchus placei]
MCEFVERLLPLLRRGTTDIAVMGFVPQCENVKSAKLDVMIGFETGLRLLRNSPEFCECIIGGAPSACCRLFRGWSTETKLYESSKGYAKKNNATCLHMELLRIILTSASRCSAVRVFKVSMSVMVVSPGLACEDRLNTGLKDVQVVFTSGPSPASNA